MLSNLAPRLLALLVLLNPSAEAKSRKFTSSDGKSLDAEIIEVANENVTLRRTSDGVDFKLAVVRFSEADQTWIKNWSSRYGAVPHPLGWKRLQVQSDSPHFYSGHASIKTDQSNGAEGLPEIYLPAGAWTHLAYNGSEDLTGLVRYDGAPVWRVEYTPHKISVSTRPGGPKRVVWFRYTHPSEGIDPSQKEPPLTVNECAALIKNGAGVELTIAGLKDLTNAKLEPVAIHLQLGQKPLSWEFIPRSVRALSISRGAGNLDLSGIQVLSRLEHLEIQQSSISGIAALQGLPILELLSLKAVTEPAEIAHLGKLTHLKHLTFLEQSRGAFPENALDCIGELTRLESVCLSASTEWDKKVNPEIAFRSCPRLTTYTLDPRTIADKGAFFARLPNLTVADFSGGGFSKEQVAELADAGQFKHLRVLHTPSHYPLRNMPHLQMLETYIYPNGKNFDNIGPLPALRTLTLANARNEDFQKLTTLSDIKEIENLILAQPIADNFNGLVGMTKLNHLSVFSMLGTNADFSGLTSLETLSIDFAQSLYELNLPPNLNELAVSGSDSLDFSSVTPLADLNRLSIETCNALKDLTPFASCSKLTHLNLILCRHLETTAGLEKSKNITHGLIHSCGSVPNWSR